MSTTVVKVKVTRFIDDQSDVIVRVGRRDVIIPLRVVYEMRNRPKEKWVRIARWWATQEGLGGV